MDLNTYVNLIVLACGIVGFGLILSWLLNLFGK